MILIIYEENLSEVCFMLSVQENNCAELLKCCFPSCLLFFVDTDVKKVFFYKEWFCPLEALLICAWASHSSYADIFVFILWILA